MNRTGKITWRKHWKGSKRYSGYVDNFGVPSYTIDTFTSVSWSISIHMGWKNEYRYSLREAKQYCQDIEDKAFKKWKAKEIKRILKQNCWLDSREFLKELNCGLITISSFKDLIRKNAHKIREPLPE